jgi:NTP pyrophosphatase (non-canonical NTP hydrolase)
MTKENATSLLPTSWAGLAELQSEFDRYQCAGFPERGAHFFALELAGETGELANLEKKDWLGREVSPGSFADEAADVCIALLNYANARGIDLAVAAKTKMAQIDRHRREQTGIPPAGTDCENDRSR